MKCNLCGLKKEAFTSLKRDINSESKGKNWELEVCDDCRIDLLRQLMDQFILENWINMR